MQWTKWSEKRKVNWCLYWTIKPWNEIQNIQMALTKYQWAIPSKTYNSSKLYRLNRTFGPSAEGPDLESGPSRPLNLINSLSFSIFWNLNYNTGIGKHCFKTQYQVLWCTWIKFRVRSEQTLEPGERLSHETHETETEPQPLSAPLMKQKHSPGPWDLLARIFSLCMKERDQGKEAFKDLSCSWCTHNEGTSGRDLWLAIHLRDAWYIALLHCAIHLPARTLRAIRVHCGSDLAILHTLAALDQMGCRTISGSESSAKLWRALKPCTQTLKPCTQTLKH